MLTVHVNAILQVTHACGGQFKYIGHNICFLEDIASISNTFPHLISDLEILVVTKHGSNQKAYELFISIAYVVATLDYKIVHDPHYNDVHIDQVVVTALPSHPMDVSSLIHHITSSSPNPKFDLASFNHELPTPPTTTDLQPSSFVSIVQNSHTKIE